MHIYSSKTSLVNFIRFCTCAEWTISIISSLIAAGSFTSICKKKIKMDIHIKENVIVLLWMNITYYEYLHLHKCYVFFINVKIG